MIVALPEFFYYRYFFFFFFFFFVIVTFFVPFSFCRHRTLQNLSTYLLYVQYLLGIMVGA